jgi:hypothetical protein
MVKTLALVAAAAALVACSSDDSGSGQTSSGAPPAPSAGPGEFRSDYKTSPDFFSNMSALVPGTSPHGHTHIWYSANVRELVGTDSFTAPEGTTSIKEFDMDGDGTVDGIAVMIKKESGYDADNGDWYYDMRDPEGNVMDDPPPGKIAMCISCHAGSRSTDYLAGTKMR